MYSPFDFNEALGHKKEYIEDNLREGSPVVGLAYDKGLLLLTLRRSQRKVYEIYDRQMFSAIGKQADIENIRLSSIQYAHQEGFERSPDDVTIQRLAGFYLSPALKKAFGDHMTSPFVIRAIFAEMGKTSANDIFYTLNYDGEFQHQPKVAVIAGSQTAEDKMLERIGDIETLLPLEEALSKALSAWTIGAREALRRRIGNKADEDDEFNLLRDVDEADADQVFLKDELKTAQLEVAILERRNGQQIRFRLLSMNELEPLLASHS